MNPTGIDTKNIKEKTKLIRHNISFTEQHYEKYLMFSIIRQKKREYVVPIMRDN